MNMDPIKFTAPFPVEVLDSLLSSLFDQISDPVFILDETGRVLDKNDAALRLFGDIPLPLIQADVIAPLKQSGKTEINLTLDDKNGNRLKGICALQWISTPNGSFITAWWRGITEKKHDFSRIQKEIEDFAYVVSHDLQSPLKKMISFGDLLNYQLNSNLDEKSRHYLDRIQKSALRMVELIKGLTEYSKAVLAEKENQQVDLNEVFGHVRSDLEIRITELKAEINSDSLPSLRANRQQMHHLFLNLLSNALDFAGKTPPLITIGVKQEASQWVFSVKDNGIGIDPKYGNRIFDIFQRIDSEGKPGTGVGLTICKRIVESHGGRIWYSSKPDEGTTIFFSLGLNQPSLNP